MTRLTVVACLVLAVPGRGQNLDQQIQKDFESVLELAAAPKEATEEQRKAKVEQFKAALVRFVAGWEPRAAELGAGRWPFARALLLLGRPDQSIPHLEQFIRDNPKSEDLEEATLSLGGAYLDSRRHDKAEKLYQEFLAAHPSSQKRVVARYYLAVTHLESGQTDSGLAELADVVKSGGEHPIVADASLKLVQGLAEAGRVTEARDRLAGLLKQHPSEAALLALKEQLDWIGKPAPEIDGVRTWLNGPGKSLADLRGTVVVLTFFAEHYDSSRAELGQLKAMATKNAGRPVQFLGLTTYYRKKTRKTLDEEDKLLQDFVNVEGVPFPVGIVSDFRMLLAYGVRGVPHTVVIGADGNVDYVKIGASRAPGRGPDLLAAAVERALAAKK
jgi:TolA-binding protein